MAQAAKAGAAAKEGLEVAGKAATVWKDATKGQCCVLPVFRVNCTRKPDGSEAGFSKCPTCEYTFCSYHLQQGSAFSTGGHQCRPQKLECSVIGMARNNCDKPGGRCPTCKYVYCNYHFRPAGWYSMQGGHTCS